jgi:hypothetical protein
MDIADEIERVIEEVPVLRSAWRALHPYDQRHLFRDLEGQIEAERSAEDEMALDEMHHQVVEAERRCSDLADENDRMRKRIDRARELLGKIKADGVSEIVEILERAAGR